jgi:hypothetical protein
MGGNYAICHQNPLQVCHSDRLGSSRSTAGRSKTSVRMIAERIDLGERNSATIDDPGNDRASALAAV